MAKYSSMQHPWEVALAGTVGTPHVSRWAGKACMLLCGTNNPKDEGGTEGEETTHAPRLILMITVGREGPRKLWFSFRLQVHAMPKPEGER